METGRSLNVDAKCLIISAYKYITNKVAYFTILHNMNVSLETELYLTSDRFF